MSSHTHRQHFNSLEEWRLYGPDLGEEYFPKFITPTQTFQQWLQENPEGYVNSGMDELELAQCRFNVLPQLFISPTDWR